MTNLVVRRLRPPPVRLIRHRPSVTRPALQLDGFQFTPTNSEGTFCHARRLGHSFYAAQT